MKEILIFLTIQALVSCGVTEKKDTKTVYVSIAPLAYMVEQIADSSVTVKVLVPETTSPETFEPSVSDIQQVAKSQLYICTGLIDFEAELNKSLFTMSEELQVLDLSESVEVLAGSCSHPQHSNHSSNESASHHSGHSHGIDPHTWLSPKLMKAFAIRIKAALDKVYPENSAKHQENLDALVAKINTLDNYISSQKLGIIAIAHPSLTYFARDYRVEQVSIEVEGKEPTIAQMKETIEYLRKEKIKKIFYQKQTSDAAAKTIAQEVGAEVIEFDPLEKDWISNLYFITNHLKNEK